MVAPISDARARQFAEALITHGGRQTQAARACGYPDDQAISQRAKELARNPKVLRILQPLAAQHLASLTPQAIQTLAGLLTNKSGYIRLEAAKDILNRNGVGAAPEQARQPPLVIRINLGADDERRMTHPPHLEALTNDTNDLASEGSELPTLLPTSQQPLTEGDPPESMASEGAEQPLLTELAAPDDWPDLSLDCPTENYAQAYATKPGGPKSQVPNFATTPLHDFPRKSTTGTQDFSSKGELDQEVGRLDGGASEVLDAGEEE